MKKHFSRGTGKDEKILHGKIASNCKYGIVELGVLHGKTTEVLLKNAKDINVYGIDPIIPDSMNAKMIGDIKKLKELEQLHSNFKFIKDYSYNTIKEWKHDFDYLFIDASHLYEDVKRDFEQWFPLLKVGGYVSLHDSAANRGGPYWWDGPSNYVDNILFKRDDLEYVDTIFAMTTFKKIK